VAHDASFDDAGVKQCHGPVDEVVAQLGGATMFREVKGGLGRLMAMGFLERIRHLLKRLPSRRTRPVGRVSREDYLAAARDPYVRELVDGVAARKATPGRPGD